MSIFKRYISFFSAFLPLCTVLSLLFSGCVGGDFGDVVVSGFSDGRVEARLGVSQPGVRTELDPTDLSTVRWSVGDEAAVWAREEVSGSVALFGERFTLRYYGTSYDSAEFSAMVDPLDEDLRYIYSAFHPYPSAINSDGTVLYRLPSLQSGFYDGVADVRVADEVVGGGITGSTLGGASLSFRSLTHAFVINIVEGQNILCSDGGSTLKELIVEMPVDVVGDFSFDMSDSGSAPAAVGDGSRGVMVAMDGRSEGWMFFNPVSAVTGTLKIYGVDSDNRYSKSYDISLDDHTFGPGRITPVYTKVMEEMDLTTLRFTLTANNIGEDLDFIRFIAPLGVVFRESGSNVVEFSCEGDVVSASFSLSYYDYFYGDLLRSEGLSVEFESASAVVPGALVDINSITRDGFNDLSLAAPYPIFMDFSCLTEDFSVHDNQSTGVNLGSGADSGYDEWTDLSDYGLPQGWTAGRVGGSATSGTLRICGREEAGSKYPGRLDSPRFSWLKAGKSVTVRVSYSYSGGKTEYKGWGGYNGTPWYQFGYETRSEDGLNGNTELGNVIQGWSYQGTSGGYASVTNNTSHVISGATSDTRASWRASCDKGSALIQNGNYWLYLDNITVQIVP